jgi:hypothetical protein
MRRIIVILAVLVLVATGCGGDGSASAPSPTEAATAEPVEAQDAAALEGTWRTGVVTREEMEAGLRAAGLEEWIEQFRELPADEPPGDSNVLTLSLEDGRWATVWAEDENQGGDQIDLGRFEVDGGRLVYLGEDWSTSYEWTVNGDMLSLTLVDTDGPGHMGIPEEVFVRAFYTTESFQRQP